MNQDEQRQYGQRLIEEARRTNAERDGEDRSHGFAAPGAGPYLLLQTALTAIDAGLMTGDWPCGHDWADHVPTAGCLAVIEESQPYDVFCACRAALPAAGGET